MNKQLKILENKVKMLEKEAAELTKNCDARLELLARNDAIYQNMQGQIMEKRKRLNDMNDFLSMMQEDKTIERGTTEEIIISNGTKKRKRTTPKTTESK